MANGRLTQMEYDSFLQTLNVEELNGEEIDYLIAAWCKQYLLMTQSMKDRFWVLFDEIMDVDEVFEILHSGTF